MPPDREARMIAAFTAGRRASEMGGDRDDNPHGQGDDAHDAWDAGWAEEEGPAFTITAIGGALGGRMTAATLADIWPTSNKVLD